LETVPRLDAKYVPSSISDCLVDLVIDKPDPKSGHMNFADEANMIQNGSHPTAPPNPVLYALSDLQTEVQEIVAGFQTRLQKLLRDGQHAFGGAVTNDDFFRPAEPGVSILPIYDGDQPNAEAENNGPPIVIGRSKQEVLEALGRAEEQAARETGSPDDLKWAAEEVVGSIVREAEPPTGATHAEL
jgi:hypothetical protein